MRLRNKVWAEPLIAEHPELLVTSPNQFKGNWQSRFEKDQPLFIEIGMGKGGFIMGMARKFPEYNFIGIELQTTIAAITLKKQVEAQIPNLQLILGNGDSVTEFFDDNEVDGIYLNFSDPWPKTRQAKRRLTHSSFLKGYEKVMKNEGHLEFKTDNRGLFEYSLVSLNEYGMSYDQVWLDLHASIEAEDNVMTEYEEKFSKKGQPIYKLEAHFKALKNLE
ncbi:tRNA (guanosine(46)-N7)-methyltransferase TrmB [Dellaglioa sp. L3N]